MFYHLIFISKQKSKEIKMMNQFEYRISKVSYRATLEIKASNARD